MKNKGYTLVEVIAVIAILSLIILIAIPAVSNTLKSSKNKAYNTQLEEIKSATKAWGLLNVNNVPDEENEVVTITLLQLKLANLITSNLNNPKTGDLFPDDLQISITKKGMNLIYDVIENSGSSNEILNPNAPQLILNGGINQSVEINETYDELGATAKDKNGNIINVNITITDKNGASVNSINTNSLNKYTITYSATSNSLTSSIKRVVSIVDTTLPVISVSGYTNNQYINLEASTNYALPVASVTDNSGEVLDYYILGNFSSVIPGSKKITYVSVDSGGNKGEFVLNFIINDTVNPVISSATVSNNRETGKNTIRVIASDSGVGLHEYAYSYDGGATWKNENTYVTENGSSSNVSVRDKIGNTTTIVPTVLSSNQYILVVDPAFGSWREETVSRIFLLESGQTISIENPTRSNYNFRGWLLTGRNSTFDDSTFTMGNADATLTANWEVIFDSINYAYNGGAQEFVVPADGWYQVELWGAQGGDANTTYTGGKGAYTSGKIKLTANTKLYVYVGQKSYTGGYNGGGGGGTDFTYGAGGGGSTDIRFFDGITPTTEDLIWNSTIGLNSRIIVSSAGGGGSSRGGGYGDGKGGAGGGLTGYSGEFLNYTNGYGNCSTSGGTQTSGGLVLFANNYRDVSKGVFGAGGTYNSTAKIPTGGGGGYYGGGGYAHAGGSGGSSYISGHTGCVAITSSSDQTPKSGCTTGTADNNCSIHYSNKVFTETLMIDGSGYVWTNVKGAQQQMPNPNGGYYELGVGHTGNGFAKITYLGDN